MAAAANKNRETWLNAAKARIATEFAEFGYPLHDKIRISVGFPLGGFEKIAGQCFKQMVSKDRHNEIFISPLIDEPFRALDILVHELIHAQDDCASGHDKHFTKLARLFDLEGKPTATQGGKAFKQRYAQLVATLGEYPHQALNPSKIKRQGTRLIKAECKECGYVCRVTQKWIDAAGAPICPACDEQMTAGEK